MLVVGVDGNDHLEEIKLNREFNGKESIKVDGLFIENRCRS